MGTRSDLKEIPLLSMKKAVTGTDTAIRRNPTHSTGNSGPSALMIKDIALNQVAAPTTSQTPLAGFFEELTLYGRI